MTSTAPTVLTPAARPGIREIAEHLSLSIGTVSKALNGMPGVGEQTRERVRAAADALGYVSNQQARALRQGRTHTLGMILPTMSNPVYAERMAGVYQMAKERGFTLMVTASQWDVEIEKDLCRTFLERGVEGVLVAVPASADQTDHWRQLLEAEIAVVSMSEVPRLAGLRHLCLDMEAGMYQLMRHLLELGHRRPLLLGRWDHLGPACVRGVTERKRGVMRALADGGWTEGPLEVLAVEGGGDGLSAAHQAVRAFLERGSSLPTVICAMNDVLAMGAIAALSEAGLRVPEDVSVTGFDNIELSRFTVPPLTTVSPVFLDFGQKALDLLLAEIAFRRGEAVAPRVEHLACEPVIRRSTAPPRQHEVGSVRARS